jgi:hypothetical protein
MKGTYWTEEERALLRQLLANGLSQNQMARMLGRTKHSVHRQLVNLGLVSGDRNPVRPHAERPAPRPVGHPRAPKTTLPPLPSLMDEGA